MSNIFPRIGDIVKLARCDNGCTGVQGHVGIITEKISNNGHLKTSVGFNVEFSPNSVWRVSGDWVLFKDCVVKCENSLQYEHVTKNSRCFIIEDPKFPVMIPVESASVSSKNVISYNEYNEYIDLYLSQNSNLSKVELLMHKSIEEQAKERYPIGSKFIDLVNGIEFTVKNHDFDTFGHNNLLYIPVLPKKGVSNKTARIYFNGKWATSVVPNGSLAGVNKDLEFSLGKVFPIQGVNTIPYEDVSSGQSIECGPGLLAGVEKNSKTKVKLIYVKKIE